MTEEELTRAKELSRSAAVPPGELRRILRSLIEEIERLRELATKHTAPPGAEGWDHWRSMAADTVNHFWFTNREAAVLLAEIDRLSALLQEYRDGVE